MLHLQPSQTLAGRTTATSRAANWLLSTKAQRLACPDVTAWELLVAVAIARPAEVLAIARAIALVNTLMLKRLGNFPLEA